MLTKYRIYTAEGYTETLDSEDAQAIHARDGIQPIETITFDPAEHDAAQATAQQTGALTDAAKSELEATDMVAIRCVKAGVDFPADWKQFVSVLREIIANGSGEMPIRPAYPDQT